MAIQSDFTQNVAHCFKKKTRFLTGHTRHWHCFVHIWSNTRQFHYRHQVDFVLKSECKKATGIIKSTSVQSIVRLVVQKCKCSTKSKQKMYSYVHYTARKQDAIFERNRWHVELSNHCNCTMGGKICKILCHYFVLQDEKQISHREQKCILNWQDSKFVSYKRKIIIRCKYFVCDLVW